MAPIATTGGSTSRILICRRRRRQWVVLFFLLSTSLCAILLLFDASPRGGVGALSPLDPASSGWLIHGLPDDPPRLCGGGGGVGPWASAWSTIFSSESRRQFETFRKLHPHYKFTKLARYYDSQRKVITIPDLIHNGTLEAFIRDHDIDVVESQLRVDTLPTYRLLSLRTRCGMPHNVGGRYGDNSGRYDGVGGRYLSVELEERESGALSVGGSELQVLSYSQLPAGGGHTADACPISDHGNGTYRITCPAHAPCVTVRVTLRFVHYNQYRGNNVALSHQLGSALLCDVNWGDEDCVGTEADSTEVSNDYHVRLQADKRRKLDLRLRKLYMQQAVISGRKNRLSSSTITTSEYNVFASLPSQPRPSVIHYPVRLRERGWRVINGAPQYHGLPELPSLCAGLARLDHVYYLGDSHVLGIWRYVRQECGFDSSQHEYLVSKYTSSIHSRLQEVLDKESGAAAGGGERRRVGVVMTTGAWDIKYGRWDETVNATAPRLVDGVRRFVHSPVWRGRQLILVYATAPAEDVEAHTIAMWGSANSKAAIFNGIVSEGIRSMERSDASTGNVGVGVRNVEVGARTLDSRVGNVDQRAGNLDVDAGYVDMGVGNDKRALLNDDGAAVSDDQTVYNKTQPSVRDRPRGRTNSTMVGSRGQQTAQTHVNVSDCVHVGLVDVFALTLPFTHLTFDSIHFLDCHHGAGPCEGTVGETVAKMVMEMLAGLMDCC